MDVATDLGFLYLCIHYTSSIFSPTTPMQARLRTEMRLSILFCYRAHTQRRCSRLVKLMNGFPEKNSSTNGVTDANESSMDAKAYKRRLTA